MLRSSVFTLNVEFVRMGLAKRSVQLGTAHQLPESRDRSEQSSTDRTHAGIRPLANLHPVNIHDGRQDEDLLEQVV